MTLPRRLKFRAWAPSLKGEGGQLVVDVEAARTSERGNTNWRGTVELEVDRHFVRQFMDTVKEMQNRDRARLARERARLDYELEPVQKTGNSQEAK